MTVLDALPSIEVSVLVAGKELMEYEGRNEVDDEPLASKTVLRYIESISGSEFAINLVVLPLFHLDCPEVVFNVFVDGNYIVRDRLLQSPALLLVTGIHRY